MDEPETKNYAFNPHTEFQSDGESIENILERLIDYIVVLDKFEKILFTWHS